MLDVTVSDIGATERIDRVFVSYAAADESIARGIANSLRQAGIFVFDQSNIEAGQNLLSAITEEIEKSDATVIIVSESSRRSEWLQIESSLAVGSALSNISKIVLPVFIGVRRNIPTVLSDIKALSFATGASPDNVGTAVLEALGRPIFRHDDYLYDSLVLQVKSLRALQEREELRLRQRDIGVIRHSGWIGLTLTLVAIVFIAAGFVIVVKRGSGYIDWVNIIALAVVFPNLIISILAIRRQRQESEAGGDE